MEIRYSDIGKKYNKRWIFRNLDGHIRSGEITGIAGNNGSGKSTLLKMLIGLVPPSEGTINYFDNAGSEVKSDGIHKYLAYSAPYMSLIEEFTIKELYNSYFSFKKPVDGIDYESFIEQSAFEEHQRKTISTFSSGMKQRLNIMFALASKVPILFFDEPTSFLDDERKDWFFESLNTYHNGRTIVIASNETRDLMPAENVYSLN